ncbi:hypothetical protein SIID45300_02740 [Candidatus Magnetaquicoccaceae bacterium FCR-1]|uniref:Fido domain-containing protein n=1 Tax=Candidatus Magnetaquiglobus chichijimensis TaxID=3141448 RepID=A0ABQ0CBW7_9PROT
MEYAFITDLEDVTPLASSELFALAQVWQERREELEGSGAFQEFMRRLYREWAIETGLIERLYHWDRGVTELLIEQGIEASLIAHRGNMSRDQAEGVAALIQDQRHVVDWLFHFVKSERELSEGYIRQLHAAFTRQQQSISAETPDGRRIEVPLLKGAYKQHPNNPRREDGSFHHYCPPEFVADEMERLLVWYHGHVKSETPPEVLAAFLHHRFTQIHPFQDGNGRVARALASLVFIKNKLFPLVIRDEERRVYIDALEQADQGRLKPLCDFFVRSQRRSILKALEVEQQLPENRHAEAILSSGLKLLHKKAQVDHQELAKIEKVNRLAGMLDFITKQRYEEMLKIIKQENLVLQKTSDENYFDIIIDNNKGFISSLESLESVGIIDKIILRNKYDPLVAGLNSKLSSISILTFKNMSNLFSGVNMGNCEKWERVSIISNLVFQFVVSFHWVYSENKTILTAISFILFREFDGSKNRYITTNCRVASPDFFQFNYKEDEASVVARFKEWLEESLAIGLGEWHKMVAREVVGFEDGAA